MDISNLSDILSTYEPPAASCGVGKWVDGLEDGTRDSVKKALEDKVRWPNTSALFAVLADAGLDRKIDQFNRHRNGSCGCKKTAVEAGARGTV